MGTPVVRAEDGAESWTGVGALFASWQPSLLRYATRLCGTPELAEDLVQEAFLALCRKSVKGEDVHNPRQWTLCVVRYRASREFRDRRRHGEELRAPEMIDSAAAPAVRADEPDPGREIGRLLAAGILSPREEQVFRLRMQSLTYRRIAAHLEVSPKTVGTLLARARHKLRDALAADRPAA